MERGRRRSGAIVGPFPSDAAILILEEATSSRDSASESAIHQAMVRLLVDRTVLIIAH
jgi:ATP-binding cassette subfamily B protein